MASTVLTVVRFWHFHCPECGMGDQEFGHLAEAHDIHCEVCLVDQDRHVRLRRWLADDESAAHAPAATRGN